MVHQAENPYLRVGGFLEGKLLNRQLKQER